jgi:P4 family phage/plasmid primase-like protien
MTTEPKLHKGATYYASLGWQIIPCHGITSAGVCTCSGGHKEPKDVGKHPAINSWNTAASSDAGQMLSWWTDNPDYNVGVFCRPSGFFVIDIDPRSGGFESFEKFEELVEGFLPPTIEAETGEYSHKGRVVRGRHLYYKVDQNENLIGNLKAANLPGIDIKHNGYVLLPPSRHTSGVEYQWKPGHAPWEHEIAEAPEELLMSLRKKGARSGSTVSTSGGGRGVLTQSDWSFLGGLQFQGEKLDVDKLLQEGIEEGSRAVDLYAMACALANTVDVNTEMGRTMVETTMIRFNAEKVKPPLELEGPGGLLSHVHRAIEFVQNNPKSSRSWADVPEWEKKAAKSVAEGTFRGVQKDVVQYNTSDPDDDNSYAPGTVGGVVSSVLEAGGSISAASRLSNMDVPRDQDAISEEDGGTPGMRSPTDTGNGRRLVDAFGRGIRYTPGLGWFYWSGQHWKQDMESLHLKELTKSLPSIIAGEVKEYDDTDKKQEIVKWAVQAKSNTRIRAAIESANSDPRINVGVEEWDSNPHLLGVANGVIDLRTGTLLSGRPDLHITRKAPVAYTPGLRNTRFQEFLEFATGGDVEYQKWLQRVVGYTMTGLVKYDIMFLMYGPSGSGKNTFVEAIVKCLGTSQYAWPMDSTVLAQDDGRSNQTDQYHWAQLIARRMVWVDELPEGERIKENAIKKLTGSSEISARSPGEKPFTFQSQGKLWLTTNHRPIITDDAMWRRIRPMPWLHVPKNPDPSLKEYLFSSEHGQPAILAWAVEGAIEVLNSKEPDPIGWCKIVYEAAEMYRKDEDRLGMFLNQETQLVEGGTLPMKSAYAVYKIWSEERGEKPMTQIALTRKMKDRGLEIKDADSHRAEIVGRTLIPRTPGSMDSIDWTAQMRFAR